MSYCDAPGLLPLEEAITRLTQVPQAALGVTRLPLLQALNHITADDIRAPINIPNYDNAAMDGYAFNCTHWSLNQPLKLTGKSFAGAAFEGEVQHGECVRIMTGAKVPEGCNCVVMQELTEVNDHLVFVTRAVNPGDNIRLAGNDVTQGQPVLAKGTRLGPRAIGMLATLGYATVDVWQPLRVGLFSTGDEITPLGSPLKEGFVYDSNRYLLHAALLKLGMQVEDFGVLPDHPEQIENTLQTAANRCDAIISSGGVSVGEADFTRSILGRLGEITFYKLAMKPGKPFACGTINNANRTPATRFFGLPGNPVSAAVTFHQLAAPCLRRMAGEKVTTPLQLQARSLEQLPKKPGRVDFQRGWLTRAENGELQVSSCGNQSSGALFSLVNANCYILLEKDRSNVEPGETVEVLPLLEDFA